LSSDSKYLYVLNPAVIIPGPSHIDVYRIGSGGSLTPIQHVADAILPNSVARLGVIQPSRHPSSTSRPRSGGGAIALKACFCRKGGICATNRSHVACMRYAARPSEGAQAGAHTYNGGLHGKGSR